MIKTFELMTGSNQGCTCMHTEINVRAGLGSNHGARECTRGSTFELGLILTSERVGPRVVKLFELPGTGRREVLIARPPALQGAFHTTSLLAPPLMTTPGEEAPDSWTVSRPALSNKVKVEGPKE